MDWKPNVVIASFFHVVVAIIFVYDMVAITLHGDKYTVTYVVREWSAQFPILPLAVGLVLGHLFFCRNEQP